MNSRPLRIVVGCDDAGLQYKDILRRDLESHPRVESVIDVGVGPDEHTAYPHVAVMAARMVAEGAADRALLICGTGLGSRSPPTRSPASVPSPPTTVSVERAILSNDAQVLCFGQRVVGSNWPVAWPRNG